MTADHTADHPVDLLPTTADLLCVCTPPTPRGQMATTRGGWSAHSAGQAHGYRGDTPSSEVPFFPTDIAETLFTTDHRRVSHDLDHSEGKGRVQ